MIAFGCLVVAALLLFWPDSAPKPSLDEQERDAVRKPAARRPSRKRKEAPKNDRKA